MKLPIELRSIELRFNYTLPESEQEIIIDANINNKGIWQQWGVPKQELGMNVELMESITEAINERGEIV